jgi:hypothetical protein
LFTNHLRSAATRLSLALLTAMLAGPALMPLAAPAVAGQKFKVTDGKTEAIVELAEGSDPALAAAELGVSPKHLYTGVITGFAADLPADAIARLQSDKRVSSIAPDGKVRVQGKRVGPEMRVDESAKSQRIPKGVMRIGVPLQKKPLDVDIAIVDTGVGPNPDLNIVGGVSCIDGNNADTQKKGKGKQNQSGSNAPADPVYSDAESHGTHVAGIAAAINNDTGVVGVAAGARIWAVKVLGSSGTGQWSDVVCGLDWVYKNRATIDVVNMSLAGNGTDSGRCTDAPVHQAICRLTRVAQIPVVVAAGNQARNAATRIPAAYSEVITVSAFSDSNGRPGGDGMNTCTRYADDSFWGSSNFGTVVDIAAPGDCILSTTPRGSARYSGTSMATPHVTGAIARYLATVQPRASVDEVRAWLLSTGSQPQESFYGFTNGKSPERALWLGESAPPATPPAAPSPVTPTAP